MRASSFVHWTRELTGAAAANEIQIHKCLENTHGALPFRRRPVQPHPALRALGAPRLFQFPGGRRAALLAPPAAGRGAVQAILDHVRPQVILSTHGSLNHGFFDLAREHLGRGKRALRDVLRRAVRQVRVQPPLGQPGRGSVHRRGARNVRDGAQPGDARASARRWAASCSTRAFTGRRSPPTSAPRCCAAWGWTRTSSRCCCPRASTGRTTTWRFWKRCAAHSRARISRSSRCADATRARWNACATGRSANPALPVLALPHSHMMHLLMQASSAIVARPGTGTTSEAIISGCPIIFNTLGGFMPQEWITLRYAQRHGFDTRAYRADDLPAILAAGATHRSTYAGPAPPSGRLPPAAHPRDILRLVSDWPRRCRPDPPAAIRARRTCSSKRAYPSA